VPSVLQTEIEKLCCGASSSTTVETPASHEIGAYRNVRSTYTNTGRSALIAADDTHRAPHTHTHTHARTRTPRFAREDGRKLVEFESARFSIGREPATRPEPTYKGFNRSRTCRRRLQSSIQSKLPSLDHVLHAGPSKYFRVIILMFLFSVAICNYDSHVLLLSLQKLEIHFRGKTLFNSRR